MEYGFTTRYLAAKKSVDDRALNRHVWTCLTDVVRAEARRPLAVLEIGAGIGTMVERLLEWGLLTDAHVTAIDADADHIAVARDRLPRWAAGQGWPVTAAPAGFGLAGDGRQVTVALETVDLFDFITREGGRRAWDLLVAHAVLDLLDVGTALPRIMTLVRPGGLLYLTLTFDGATILQPEIYRAFDVQIEALFH